MSTTPALPPRLAHPFTETHCEPAPNTSQPESDAALSRPRRPDLAQELTIRAAAADENWSHLLHGRLSHQQIGRGRLADHANAEVLRRIIDDHGWPGRSLVGDDGATAAWRIALRADNHLYLQRHAEHLMRNAVILGEASRRQWAHLHDRCLLQKGARQEYGTQYRFGRCGDVEREPVHDPDRLDARRADIGLPPAAAALEALRRRLAHGQAATNSRAADADPVMHELTSVA
ncbi:DUF6624 domain-containing protein [Streptomyces sp. NPDC006610]|uniref:DUF6624 domain-containing protein n=1 Tax=Streptomyces sp. NPDC006610 TaxID=3154584 RepID=UPI0033BE1811